MIRRILLVCLLVLVLPLIVHSLFLYEREYKQNLREWSEDVRVLARERANLAELLLKEGRDLAPVERPVAFTHPTKAEIVRRPKAPPDSLFSFEKIEGSDLYVQVAMETSSISELQTSTYARRFLALFAIFLSLSVPIVYFLIRRISRPWNQLRETMRKITKGELSLRYEPDRFGYEINELGQQFNQTLDALKKAQKSSEELRIGHAIQKGLLPTVIPGISGLEIGVVFLAAKEVNGDFYDFLELRNGKFLVVISDAAGKGISACLFSLGLRSSIRSLAMEGNPLHEIVSKANDLYCLDGHASGMFSTLWIGLYDPKSCILEYASQGHPPALLKNEEIQELSTGGMALGVQPLEDVQVNQIRLKDGDQLLLYTDGVMEAHGPKGEFFGQQRIAQHMQKGAVESVEAIAEAVRHFSQDMLQHDDITLVVLNKSF